MIRKSGPRAEHRERENARANRSESLAHKFPLLTSAYLDLAFSNSDGRQASTIRYRPNLENARSVFLLDCPNPDCVEGDFDLSHDLATAYVHRHEAANGEVRCQGWRSPTTVGRSRCDSVLRFQLHLEYEQVEAGAEAGDLNQHGPTQALPQAADKDGQP